MVKNRNSWILTIKKSSVPSLNDNRGNRKYLLGYKKPIFKTLRKDSIFFDHRQI